MKIAHLTWGLGVGGAESLILDVAARQARRHEVSLVVGNQDVDPDVLGAIDTRVRLIRIDRPAGSRNPWYPLKLAANVRKIGADVLHAHHDSFGVLKPLLGSPMLLTVHNTRLPLEGRLAGFDAVCCISDAVKVDVEARFPALPLRVVPNGVDFDAISQREERRDTSFRVVQVGRLAHEQKGQDILIHALRRVIDRDPSSDVRVDFIGDGASRAMLQTLSYECGVAHRCRFLGARTRAEIHRTLRDYDVLVQPSRYEGFGLTVVEGLAAHLPVVVSDIEGPSEIVGNGIGWTFRSEDSHALAERLLEIRRLQRGPGFAQRMVQAAEAARDRFDLALTADAYVGEYLRIAERAG